MTRLSQPRRSRILPPSAIAPEELHRRQEQRQALAVRCRELRALVFWLASLVFQPFLPQSAFVFHFP